MRMRKKPNLVPRMERCAATMITEPEALRGRWLEQFPGHRALQLELGCGKGLSLIHISEPTRPY